MRNYFCLLAFCLSYLNISRCQSDVRVISDHATVSAGESIEWNVDLGRPSECQRNLLVIFQTQIAGATYEIDARGTIANGAGSAVVRADIPLDQKPGIYTSLIGRLDPCPRYSNFTDLKVPKITMTVTAPSQTSPNQTQKSDVEHLSFSLTQEQFFNTKISDFDDLDTQINDWTRDHPKDDAALRDFLSGIVSDADKLLTSTEKQFRQQILKPGQEMPAFFADFHAQYDSLRIELKQAPYVSRRADINEAPVRISYVGFQRVSALIRPAGLPPPIVTSVKYVLADNIGAFMYVKDTGLFTFDLKLTSSPPGAHIYFKMTTEDKWEEYSVPTDVEKATFAFASWDFRFRKDGCKDPVDKPDYSPYRDSVRIIAVKFSRCKAR